MSKILQKNLMENDKIIKCLNEAVDAIGDIPAEQVTKQQKKAYKLCVEERDKLTLNPNPIPKLNAEVL
jgi:hypothetical protein